MLKSKISDLLNKNININDIKINDLSDKHKNHATSDGGGHFKITIISDDFKNESLLIRHKKIYTILDSMLKKEIHALSLKTLTIEESQR
jgi:BolA protein|tara:strand:- start:643 stop:909 length:267 start_codon:yes stop_codon:yes gene_type:complete